MNLVDVLRLLGPPALAFAMVLGLDRLMDRRGLTPPLFSPGAVGEPGWLGGARRGVAGLALFVLFWLAIFAPLALVGTERTVEGDEVAWALLILQTFNGLDSPCPLPWSLPR